MVHFGHRRKRKRVTALNEISMTPMIDTAFTLLIIFMVTTPMLDKNKQSEGSINFALEEKDGKLPEGQLNEAEGVTQEIVVRITHQGVIMVNDTVVTMETLSETIKKLLKGSTSGTVFIKADKAAPWGTIGTLIDRIKSMEGIRNVAVATNQVVS